MSPAPEDAGRRTDGRPLMAMMVNNGIVGDSRVQKAARSAAAAGYKVVLLGMEREGMPTLDTLDGIPIVRLHFELEGHRAAAHRRYYLQSLGSDAEIPAHPWTRSDGFGPAARLSALADLGLKRLARLPVLRDLVRPRGPTDDSSRVSRPPRPLLDLFDGEITSATAEWAEQNWSPEMHRPGMGRFLWPLIEDLEKPFVAALRDLHPDIVHAHDMVCLVPAATYARFRSRAGDPVTWIYDAHEWLPGGEISGGPAAKTAWLLMEAESAPQADAVVTVSEEIADRLMQRHKLPTRPTVVLNTPSQTPVPMRTAARLPLRAECGLDKTTPLLVYVGHLSHERGLDTAIDALAYLPEAHLAIVCSPTALLRDSLRERAAALGVSARVHLVDYVPAESVTWFISSATIGLCPLLPSPAHDLALATKIWEYMLAGLPMVVSNVRAQAALVQDLAIGAVHAPGNPRSLAASVRAVLADIEQHHRVLRGLRGKEYSWEAQEARLVELWQRLCPTPGEPQPVPLASSRAGIGIIGTHTSSAAALQTALRTTGRRVEVMRMAPDPAKSSGPRLEQSTDKWLMLRFGAKLLVYTLPRPLCGALALTFADEAESLRAAGHDVIALLEPGSYLYHGDMLRHVPGHPWGQWDERRIAAHNHRVETLEPKIGDARVPLFSSSPTLAGLKPAVEWLPHPVEVPSTPPAKADPPTVVVGGGLTTGTAASGPDLSEVLAARGAQVHRVDEATDHATLTGLLDRASVFVDRLDVGEYSQEAAMALARGAVVVTGHFSQPAASTMTDLAASTGVTEEFARVVLQADSGGAAAAVMRVLDDPRRSELQREAHRVAAALHSADSVLDRCAAALERQVTALAE